MHSIWKIFPHKNEATPLLGMWLISSSNQPSEVRRQCIVCFFHNKKMFCPRCSHIFQAAVFAGKVEHNLTLLVSLSRYSHINFCRRQVSQALLVNIRIYYYHSNRIDTIPRSIPYIECLFSSLGKQLLTLKYTQWFTIY